MKKWTEDEKLGFAGECGLAKKKKEQDLLKLEPAATGRRA